MQVYFFLSFPVFFEVTNKTFVQKELEICASLQNALIQPVITFMHSIPSA